MLNRMVARWSLPVVVALLVGRTAQAQTGRVTGQVTDSTSARPLPGVEVVVVEEGGRVRTSARTDAEGRYSLANVGGETRLRARVLGFASE